MQDEQEGHLGTSDRYNAVQSMQGSGGTLGGLGGWVIGSVWLRLHWLQFRVGVCEMVQDGTSKMAG